MSKFLRTLGFLWASPLTLLAAAYVFLCNIIGWYKYAGKFDNAFVWSVQEERLPQFMKKLWQHWAGHCIGNIVVVKCDLKSERGKKILRHEQEHVYQCMVLGIFQPIIYAVSSLAIKLACPRSDSYYSNPFEIEARRAADQVVDIESVLLKVSEKKARVS